MLVELERLAMDVRDRAGLAQDEVELAPRIAIRLLGPQGIARVADLSTTAYLVRLDDGYRIVALAGAADLNWSIAHEIGHWALAEIAQFRGPPAEEETYASLLGTAILAPMGAVRAAHAAFGDDENVARVASTFHVSQKSAWLRLGETLRDDRATINRGDRLRVRFGSTYPWETVGVDLARSKRPLPGLARTRLRGGIDSGCVALRVRR